MSLLYAKSSLLGGVLLASTSMSPLFAVMNGNEGESSTASKQTVSHPLGKADRRVEGQRETKPLKQSSKQTQVHSIFLDPRQRPSTVRDSIEWYFDKLQRDKVSSWGCYNGSADYGILGISQLELAAQIVHGAYTQGRRDVFILDSGAGNFQSCDSFARYINENSSLTPEDITVHIIGTRGESYEGVEIEEQGLCRLYKFGSFRIEDHPEELKKRGLNLKGKIDLTVSNWANRHYVDPLGTWVGLYHTVRPQGLMLMDWCYYRYVGESFSNKVEAWLASRRHLIDLLMYLKAPFLLKLDGDWSTKKVDQFVLQRNTDSPLKLPLAYSGEVSTVNKKFFDIGSGEVVTFTVTDDSYTSHRFLMDAPEYASLQNAPGSGIIGTRDLFNFFHTRNLGYAEYEFAQLYEADFASEKVTPLYTAKELAFRKAVREEERAKRRLQKKKEKAQQAQAVAAKRNFLFLLTLETPEIHPASVGLANGAGSVEWRLYDALREKDFVQAQKLIDKDGADVNRVFDEDGRTLLSMAVEGRLVKNRAGLWVSDGDVPFLLRNRACSKDVSLDVAHYSGGLADEDIKMLVAFGAPLKDLTLYLYRSVKAGRLSLVDLYLSLGADINAFCTGHPIVYASSCDVRMWNALLDRGARGHLGESLVKKHARHIEAR